MQIKVRKTHFSTKDSKKDYFEMSSAAVSCEYVYLLVDDIRKYFTFFPQKTLVDFCFTFSSTRDNLHEISNPLSGKNKKITNCRLLN